MNVLQRSPKCEGRPPLALFGALCIAASLGCGGKKELGKGKPVTGTVLYHDQPVADCTVTFIAPFYSAFGMTDARGRFELSTAQGENVPLGDYQVTVVKTEDLSPPEAAPDAVYQPRDANAPPPPEPKDLLPAKYKEPGTSQLTATVSEAGPNDFALTLAD